MILVRNVSRTFISSYLRNKFNLFEYQISVLFIIEIDSQKNLQGMSFEGYFIGE